MGSKEHRVVANGNCTICMSHKALYMNHGINNNGQHKREAQRESHDEGKNSKELGKRNRQR